MVATQCERTSPSAEAENAFKYRNKCAYFEKNVSRKNQAAAQKDCEEEEEEDVALTSPVSTEMEDTKASSPRLLLQLTTSKGAIIEKEFGVDAKAMILSGMDFASISIRASVESASFPQLKEVSLAANCLQKIDLTIFHKCPNLEALMLNGNQLRRIDLMALSSCSKLQRLWLHNNHLMEIDLGVALHLPALQSICLENNRLSQQLDLEPLSKCRVLRSIRLSGNQLEGELNVTSLLACKTLTSFDAGTDVRLFAFNNTDGEAPTLPPALRKRNITVAWKDKTSINSRMPSNRDCLRALAMGFQSRHLRSMSILLTSIGSLEVDSYEELKRKIDSEFLRPYSVIIVHPTMEDKLLELRAANMHIPSVIVGNGTAYADAASRCLRKGAKCFIPEPLIDRTTMTIRSLAQQYARSYGSSEHVNTQSAIDKKETSQKEVTEINFDKLRKAYDSRNGVVTESCRQRLEESALGMLSQRRKGPLQKDDFGPLVTLCGLPVCSSEALYESIVRWQKSQDPTIETESISKEVLSHYWRENLRAFDLETRLFNILCLPAEQVVTIESMRPLVRKLLQSRVGGFALLRSSISEETAYLHEEVAAAIIFYGISGTLSPLRRSQLRKAELCKTLKSAESGVFNGWAATLRPDRFQRVAKAALGPNGNNVSLSLSEVIQFSVDNRLLVPYVVKRLFLGYCSSSSQMGIQEFTRFYLATSDPSTVAATKYLFPGLDADMNGFVSAADLAMIYREKNHGVEFGILWASLHDLLSGSNCSGIVDSVSSSCILALAAKDRATLLRTMLFIDDEIEVDICRS
eukprot:Plantae.Rhodophyta-Purpureofilum_apyrenoidigerum.ctg1228.p1 GENE.Plantae.Rhodophyta-Purpureofilum_apyrenoidigerum.ctg1228~~Plantae.Rhodophyta-Purpureofilum_apyrenoidigerum.ctg1228.p1  ORF type:complete len:805 (-),score=156.46 Plantae.Rhodophyta-Purpureofilum_apyrenoidigerum.ctg1228:145-2559(-)